MPLDHTPPDEPGKKHYVFNINGVDHTTDDGMLDGRGLLQKAGFTPASDHLLIQLTHPGSRVIGLDEEVDLAALGVEAFRAFLSDRAFAFTVDEVGYAWGAPTITELELRAIADVPPDKVLIIEREDEEDQVVEEGGSVDLAARGTEHLRIGKRVITVYYGDDTPFELKPGVYTGAQLCAIFHVPANYQLDLVKPNGDFDEIGNDQRLRIKDGMHFVSHPPSGKSS